MKYLWDDPRPYEQDTQLWTRLFHSFKDLPDREKAWRLHIRLWSFRSYGVRIERTHNHTKLVPMFPQWESQEEWAYFADKYLKPYAKEILELLNKLE